MHLVQMCFWPSKLMNFEDEALTKVIHFYMIKKCMHNIHDVGSNINQKYFYVTNNGKLGLKNTKFKIII